MEAHAIGYVHRDLRPRNVFLAVRARQGQLRQAARLRPREAGRARGEAAPTSLGMTFGDPRYMSPEQARGDTHRSPRRHLLARLRRVRDADRRAALHRQRPFEVLQQHLDAPVPRVRERRADCPEWLDAMVQRALAKKPDDRFSLGAEAPRLRARAESADRAGRRRKAGHATLSGGAKTMVDEPAPEPAKSEPKVEAPHVEPVEAEAPKAELAKPAAKANKGSNGPSAHRPKETMFMGSRTTAKPKEKEKPAAKAERAEIAKPTIVDAAPPESTSGEMNTLSSAAHAEPAPVPSVVVEPTAAVAPFEGAPIAAPFAPDEPAPDYHEAPTAPPDGAAGGEPMSGDEDSHPTASMAAEPLPLPPIAGAPARGEPTGEWFDCEFERAPGAVPYDEQEEDLPKKNRGGLIIAAVSVGLLAVGAVVFALLPKPERKPLRGEQPTAASEQATVKAPAPAAAIAPAESPPQAAPAAAPTAAAPTAAAPAPAEAAPLQPSSESSRPRPRLPKRPRRRRRRPPRSRQRRLRKRSRPLRWPRRSRK